MNSKFQQILNNEIFHNFKLFNFRSKQRYTYASSISGFFGSNDITSYLSSAFGHASDFAVKPQFVVFIVTAGQYFTTTGYEECTVRPCHHTLYLLLRWEGHLLRSGTVILASIAQPSYKRLYQMVTNS